MATGTNGIATYRDLGTLAAGYTESGKCCTGNGINTYTLMAHESSNRCVKYSDIEMPYLQSIFTSTPTQNYVRLVYHDDVGKYYLKFTFYKSSAGTNISNLSDLVDIFGINSYAEQNFLSIEGSSYTVYINNEYLEGYVIYGAGQNGNSSQAMLNILQGSPALTLKKVPGYSGNFYIGTTPYVYVRFSYYNKVGRKCTAAFPLFLMISYSYL